MDDVIQAALDYHTIVNATPGRWARFEAQKFTNELIVRVYCGSVLRQGTNEEFKETYDTVRSFYTMPNGHVKHIDRVGV